MVQRANNGDGVYGVFVYDFNHINPISGHATLLSDVQAGLDPDVIPTAVVGDDDDNGNEEEDMSTQDNKLVAVFLLDVRTNKSPYPQDRQQQDVDANDNDDDSNNPYGDFLGERQWKWFETAISRSNAAVNIIVSGIQVHPKWLITEDGPVEYWNRFPHAQHRLYQAILQNNVKAPLIVSGDIHIAQMLRKDCCRRRRRRRQHRQKGEGEDEDNDNTMIRPLVEVTTSSMTHSWGTEHVCGRPTASPFCKMSYYNALFRPILDFGMWIGPWTELLEQQQQDDDDEVADDNDEMMGKQGEEQTTSTSTTEKKKATTKTTNKGGRRYPRKQYNLDLNFAEIEFDWDNESIIVNILGTEIDGKPLLHQTFRFDELSPPGTKGAGGATSSTTTTSLVQSEDFDSLERELLTKSIIKPFSDDESNIFEHNVDGTDHDYNSNDGEWICVNYRGLPNPVHHKFAFVATVTFALIVALWPLLLLCGTCCLCFWCKRKRRKYQERTR